MSPRLLYYLVSGGWWFVARRLCFITNLFTSNKYTVFLSLRGVPQNAGLPRSTVFGVVARNDRKEGFFSCLTFAGQLVGEAISYFFTKVLTTCFKNRIKITYKKI